METSRGVQPSTESRVYQQLTLQPLNNNPSQTMPPPPPPPPPPAPALAPIPTPTQIRSPSPRRKKGDPEPDYSGMVREQLRRGRRTAQACDRCRLRKLKCDQNPTGCTNCIDNNKPCLVTDRITTITTDRGALQRLQAENEKLRLDIQRLQVDNRRLLADNSWLRHQLMQYQSTHPAMPFMASQGAAAATSSTGHFGSAGSQVMDMAAFRR